MSRYDKYDPMVGGFRAPLAANFGYTSSLPDKAHADLSKVHAVGLSTAGLIGKFATAFPKFCGLLILTRPMAAGDIVDVMTDGEIVDLVDGEIKGADTLGPGTALFADTTGGGTNLLTTTSAAMIPVGFTVEISRLIVRCDLGVS